MFALEPWEIDDPPPDVDRNSATTATLNAARRTLSIPKKLPDSGGIPQDDIHVMHADEEPPAFATYTVCCFVVISPLSPLLTIWFVQVGLVSFICGCLRFSG